MAPVSGTASVVAFGRNLTVHADAEAFAASPASLLNPDCEPDEAPPPHVVEQGMVWPPRWGAESFISYGEFAEPSQAQAAAWLAGIVRTSEQRRNELTGITFSVCRVAVLGFEVDVLLDRHTHPVSPHPGQVVAGEAFLVADLDWLGFVPESAGPGRRTRRWRLRR
jgi:hypothetical protein